MEERPHARVDDVFVVSSAQCVCARFAGVRDRADREQDEVNGHLRGVVELEYAAAREEFEGTGEFAFGAGWSGLVPGSEQISG